MTNYYDKMYMFAEELRKEYPKGTRVRLENMDDKQAPPIGTLGTVTHVDDLANVHVDWDNGSTLSIVVECGDRIEKVKAKDDIDLDKE